MNANSSWTLSVSVWPAGKCGLFPISPLMLVPVKLTRKSTESARELSEYEDDAIPNYCLQQLLSSDFGIQIRSLPQLTDVARPFCTMAFSSA